MGALVSLVHLSGSTNIYFTPILKTFRQIWRNLLKLNARYTSLNLFEGDGDVPDVAVQENGLPDATKFILVDSIRDPSSWPEIRRISSKGVQCWSGPKYSAPSPFSVSAGPKSYVSFGESEACFRVSWSRSKGTSVRRAPTSTRRPPSFA